MPRHVSAPTIAQVESLSDLPAAVLDDLASHVSVHRFDRGEAVVGHGDQSRDLYIII